MYVLFIVLNKVDHLDEVLKSLVRSGVRGATILDSKGMAGAIVHGQKEDVSLFGAFKMFINGAYPYNNTIFTVVDESILENVTKNVQEVLNDVPHPGAGFMFTIKGSEIYDLGSKNKR